jgi:hypothetical protein
MALAILILFPNYPSADFCTASKMVVFHLSIFLEHPIEFWTLKRNFWNVFYDISVFPFFRRSVTGVVHIA